MYGECERPIKSELFEDEPTSQFSLAGPEPAARPLSRSLSASNPIGDAEIQLMPLDARIFGVPNVSVDEQTTRVVQENIQREPSPNLFDNLRGSDEYQYGEMSQACSNFSCGDENSPASNNQSQRRPNTCQPVGRLTVHNNSGWNAHSKRWSGASAPRHLRHINNENANGSILNKTAPSSGVPTRISDRLKTKDKRNYRHMLQPELDYDIGVTPYSATKARKPATAKNKNGAKLTNERKSRSNRTNKNKVMTFEIGPKCKPRSARLNVPAPPLPDTDLLAVPTRLGPTTRSMMTLVHIPIGILCSLDLPKRNSRPRKRTKDATYRSRSASMRKRAADAEANYHIFVESHPNAKFRERSFGNENDLHDLRNNDKRGRFVNMLIRAHSSLINLVRRPFTAEDIENVISNSFVGITPHEYDLAVKELVHLVIQNDGVLFLAGDKRFPDLTGTHIIKEQEHLNKMDLDESVEI